MKSVVISGVHNVNNLGVLRGLARKGIPVTLLDMAPGSMVRYSRYVAKRLPCPHPDLAESDYVQCLIDYGKSLDHRPVIIPTGDAEVIALSRYRDLLDPYYRLPVPSLETIDLLVNKKRFFQEMIHRSIPCPKSHFPANIDEAREMAANIPYPFIIKGAYSHRFIKEFQRKVFVVSSPPEFEAVIERLHTAQLDYFFQEMIPGNTLFLFYSYFSRQAVPLGICGYDKIHQFPNDFGIGTVCRSRNRPRPTETAVQFLKDIQYHGLAEPEFMLDPRDGLYKIIEINTRSVTMNLLTNACGVHAEYLAYQDLTGEHVEPVGSATEGVLWIDEINELHYQLSRIRHGLFSFLELWSLIVEPRKVWACAALDDPIPLIVGLNRFIKDRYQSFREKNDARYALRGH